MTRNELKKLLMSIPAAYSVKFEITQAVFDVWYENLKDLKFDSAEEGLNNYFKSNQRLPSIANVREEYNAVEKAKRAFSKSITDEYKKTVSSYPYQGNKEDMEEAWKTFVRMIHLFPREEWLDRAKDFHYDTSTYVTDSDIHNISVPIFKEYVKSYEQSIRKGSNRMPFN